MDRSGEVGDVLQVARELSNTRVEIERINARLKALRDRVAYGTINLQLEAPAIAPIPQRTVDWQLQKTWTEATHSLQQFTAGLIRLAVWLIVYSPYWLGGIFLLWLVSKRLK